MTMRGITVDATGIHAESLPEATESTQAQLREIFGSDLSVAAQTPQAQLAGLIAILKAEIGESVVGLATGIDPDTASGTLLDAQGALLDITRLPARKSLVTATLTGVAATVVVAGSRAKTAAGDEFKTLADAVLAPSGVSVDMEAVEDGPIPAASSTITTIVTIVPGWETITNTAAATPGQAKQADQPYRSARRIRTAHRAFGPLDALKAGLVEAGAGRYQAIDNNADTAATVQEWVLRPHAILVVAETGTDGDIRRAVETHRGMGVPTMSAILGGAPNNTALAAISNGTVNWNGTDYTGLDLTSATTGAARATALDALLPADVTVRFINGRYVAFLAWKPTASPAFGTGTVETAFGLALAVSTPPPGPFVRTHKRELTVTMTVTRQANFPADGLAQITLGVIGRIAAYGVGEEVWSNDLLAAAEAVGGTRVSALTVQADSTDVSGVATALDVVWDLPTANLTITIT